MQADNLEERIRLKAYLLWQEDGSMEGCADEYWRKARAIVEAEIENERQRAAGGASAPDEPRKPADSK